MASPLAQLSRAGATITPTADGVRTLRQHWSRQHYVVLPSFLDKPLLEFVRCGGT